MTNTLPIDTYYRGYRLSSIAEEVHVWYGADLIDSFETKAQAQETIDYWMSIE